MIYRYDITYMTDMVRDPGRLLLSRRRYVPSWLTYGVKISHTWQKQNMYSWNKHNTDSKGSFCRKRLYMPPPITYSWSSSVFVDRVLLGGVIWGVICMKVKQCFPMQYKHAQWRKRWMFWADTDHGWNSGVCATFTSVLRCLRRERGDAWWRGRA